MTACGEVLRRVIADRLLASSRWACCLQSLASTLWIVNSIYSIGYMRGNNEKHQTPLLRRALPSAIAATPVGIAFAGNLFTLFLFYEVLTHFYLSAGIAQRRRRQPFAPPASTWGFSSMHVHWTACCPPSSGRTSLAGSVDLYVPGGILEGHVVRTRQVGIAAGTCTSSASARLR